MFYIYMDNIPEGRCGYQYNQESQPYNNCCWRETWGDSDRCIWHSKNKSDSKTKTTTDLTEAIRDEPNESDRVLLDGASIIDKNVGQVFFHLRQYNVYFRNANLRNCTWSNPDPINISDFIFVGANLDQVTVDNEGDIQRQWENVDFSEASIMNAHFKNIEFTSCKFRDVDIGRTIFDNSNFSETDFDDVGIHYASKKKIPISATNCKFKKCSIIDADFSNSNFENTKFIDSNINNTDFSDSNLVDVEMLKSNMSTTSFRSSDLTRVGFQGSKLTLINMGDTFTQGSQADHETQFLGDVNYYITDPRLPDEKREQVQNIECLKNTSADSGEAARVYYKFEQISRDSALPRIQSNMFINRQEMARHLFRSDGDSGNFLFATLSKTIFLYGESLRRVLMSSGVIILIFGCVYFLTGAVTLSEQPNILPSSYPNYVNDFLNSIYFSTLIFTTLGLGDFHPTNLLGRVLVTTEAALGAILIAVFVFVLGRRSSR